MRVRCLMGSPMATGRLSIWPTTSLEGPTTQVWKRKYFRDITEYFSGEWRFGTITGVGTMHWKSGARYRCWQLWPLSMIKSNWNRNTITHKQQIFMNTLQYIFMSLMNLKFLSRYTGQILMNLMDGQGRLQFIFPLTLLEFLLFDFSCAASSFWFPGSSGPMEISTPASISTAREMASVICRWGISVIS